MNARRLALADRAEARALYWLRADVVHAYGAWATRKGWRLVALARALRS